MIYRNPYREHYITFPFIAPGYGSSTLFAPFANPVKSTSEIPMIYGNLLLSYLPVRVMGSIGKVFELEYHKEQTCKAAILVVGVFAPIHQWSTRHLKFHDVSQSLTFPCFPIMVNDVTSVNKIPNDIKILVVMFPFYSGFSLLRTEKNDNQENVCWIPNIREMVTNKF